MSQLPPNKNVLAGVVEKLQAQVTQDAPQRQEWIKILIKRRHNLTTLKTQQISDELRFASVIDANCLEWAQSGQLPQLKIPDAQQYILFVWERFCRACLFAQWLQASGCQIFDKSEQEVLAWLLTDFWKFYGRMAWRATPANSLLITNIE
jgi:hypothetical protein